MFRVESGKDEKKHEKVCLNFWPVLYVTYVKSTQCFIFSARPFHFLFPSYYCIISDLCSYLLKHCIYFPI